VLIRRLRLIHEDAQQALPQAAEVAAFMAPYLGWSPVEQARQVDAYRHQVALTRKFDAAVERSGGGVGRA
jgi:glycerol-3-phosphate dehydrogenase